MELENTRQQLEKQVRQRFRQVGIDRRRAEVAQLAEDLAARNVGEEEERLKLGLSTARQVLDAQDDLAQARASRLRALVDCNQSLIEWQRLTGD
ncbi:MAG: TolC family protein [Candidatus Handelsmanbacteria bacterium]|nr:TolC family protein [Candidatus Handelsmanbacteria bacterium]